MSREDDTKNPLLSGAGCPGIGLPAWSLRSLSAGGRRDLLVVLTVGRRVSRCHRAGVTVVPGALGRWPRGRPVRCGTGVPGLRQLVSFRR